MFQNATTSKLRHRKTGFRPRWSLFFDPKEGRGVPQRKGGRPWHAICRMDSHPTPWLCVAAQTRRSHDLRVSGS